MIPHGHDLARWHKLSAHTLLWAATIAHNGPQFRMSGDKGSGDNAGGCYRGALPRHGSEQCFVFRSAFVLFDVRGLFVFKRSEAGFCSAALFGPLAPFGNSGGAVLFSFGRSLDKVTVL